MCDAKNMNDHANEIQVCKDIKKMYKVRNKNYMKDLALYYLEAKKSDKFNEAYGRIKDKYIQGKGRRWEEDAIQKKLMNGSGFRKLLDKGIPGVDQGYEREDWIDEGGRYVNLDVWRCAKALVNKSSRKCAGHLGSIKEKKAKKTIKKVEKKAEAKQKRNLTKYNVFVRQEVAKHKGELASGEKMKLNEYMKDLAAKWKSLSQEEKDKYIAE